MAQTRQLDRGNNAGATTVTMTMQHEGKEVSRIIMMTMAQQGVHHLGNVGLGFSATRATTASWQRHRRLHINNCNDTIVRRATTPAWQWQWCHCNKGNKVIATMVKMPGLQRCLLINDSNTIAMRATMPAQQQQRSLRIDDGNDPIVTRATTPAQWLH
jgi:hypothetical protein